MLPNKGLLATTTPRGTIAESSRSANGDASLISSHKTQPNIDYFSLRPGPPAGSIHPITRQHRQLAGNTAYLDPNEPGYFRRIHNSQQEVVGSSPPPVRHEELAECSNSRIHHATGRDNAAQYPNETPIADDSTLEEAETKDALSAPMLARLLREALQSRKKEFPAAQHECQAGMATNVVVTSSQLRTHAEELKAAERMIHWCTYHRLQRLIADARLRIARENCKAQLQEQWVAQRDPSLLVMKEPKQEALARQNRSVSLPVVEVREVKEKIASRTATPKEPLPPAVKELITSQAAMEKKVPHHVCRRNPHTSFREWRREHCLAVEKEGAEKEARWKVEEGFGNMEADGEHDSITTHQLHVEYVPVVVGCRPIEESRGGTLSREERPEQRHETRASSLKSVELNNENEEDLGGDWTMVDSDGGALSEEEAYDTAKICRTKAMPGIEVKKRWFPFWDH